MNMHGTRKSSRLGIANTVPTARLHPEEGAPRCRWWSSEVERAVKGAREKAKTPLWSNKRTQLEKEKAVKTQKGPTEEELCMWPRIPSC
jgi:hypothetical protein